MSSLSPRCPADDRLRECPTHETPSLADLRGIVLLPHRLHPGRMFSVERLLHGDVGHAVIRRTAMPMLFTRRDPDHVARPDLAERPALGLHPADARHDIQRLAERM